ncbi:hypothetical protein L195_g053611, partial [Trifolium pratense]
SALHIPPPWFFGVATTQSSCSVIDCRVGVPTFLFVPLRTLTRLAKSVGSGIELHQYPSFHRPIISGTRSRRHNYEFTLWSLWSYGGLQAWMTSDVVNLQNFDISSSSLLIFKQSGNGSGRSLVSGNRERE